MIPLCFYFLILCFLFLNTIHAQTSENQYDLSLQDKSSGFQPSLAVVIGILSVMFSLTFFLLLYAKFCHRPPNAAVVNNRRQIQDGLLRSRSRFSGIDKSVIESLPLFKFSSLKGSKEGLDCAICLSKFEDIEVLRLLPKCKHAFHINCLDQWLEKHSSCPLCRNKISAEDLEALTYSNSLRFLLNDQSNLREDSNIELYVQREESRRGSSRFSITNSFRKGKSKTEEEEDDELPLPINQNSDNIQGFDKFNHRIIISGSVLKHRWSNLSSSDLMFLKSEMLLDMSSGRFSALDLNNSEESTQSRLILDDEVMDIKEEIGRKREFESKFNKFKQNDSIEFESVGRKPEESNGILGNGSKILNPNEKRSMSEIVVHSRFEGFNVNRRERISYNQENYNNVEEERVGKIWLPIARRTVQWFANRETRSTQARAEYTRQTLNV